MSASAISTPVSRAVGATANAVTGKAIRRIVLVQSKRANVGHIGSALSVADIVAALYDRVLDVPRPEDPQRDRFVLAKGHAVLAVYAALFERGWLAQADLDTYCGDGSLLGVHPEHRLRGIDFSTGSLGLGLSLGVGAVLAARLERSSRRAFVLMSDAECNEGSVWEAAMFAAHHRLGRLTAIIDLNGQQALGHTADVLSLAPMAARWRAFGWDVRDVDGHDEAALADVLSETTSPEGPPRVLVARTTFGKGVSFMEGQLKWHYWPMSDDDYRRALAEVESEACEPRSSAR
jgi:transketolase